MDCADNVGVETVFEILLKSGRISFSTISLLGPNEK